MNPLAYKVTAVALTLATKLLGVKMRVTGAEHLGTGPTLFVVNHFTRLETFLVPYIIYQLSPTLVRSLSTDSVFRGVFRWYWRACGVVSVRDPKRNRMIVCDLMTGTYNWIIYPEGGLIKTKRTVRKNRLYIDRPDRAGPPHTGAALLALRAEMSKHRFLDACAKGDDRRLDYYQRKYGLTDPGDVSDSEISIVPVTITYHGLRPGRNLVHRLARIFKRDLDPRLEEELLVEGRVALGNAEMNVHFAAPIGVREYLDAPTRLVRNLIGRFSESLRNDLLVRKQARRLTESAMRSLYQNVELHFEHIFCYGLRALRSGSISSRDFHKALYLAVLDLRTREDVRLHPSLTNGVTALLSGEPFDPLQSIVSRAEDEGVLTVRDGQYIIHHDLLEEQHEFHTVRLKRMTQVIANEVEPIRPVAKLISRVVNLPPDRLSRRVVEAIRDHDQLAFARDYDLWREDGVSKSVDLGKPFFLPARDRSVGVILSHGYMACPAEVRPLAEYLHANGCSVYGVRLDGHGTAPQEVVNVSWRDWLDSYIRGVEMLRQHCRYVVAGGFSLGGILALLAAAKFPDQIDAVATINAPLILRDRRAALVPAILRWNQLARRIGLLQGPSTTTHITESPDLNYPVIVLAGVRELRRAVRQCKARLGEITAPTLIIQSPDDPVVARASGQVIHRRIQSTSKRLVELPFNRHVIIRGNGSEVVFAEMTEFIRELFPDHITVPVRNTADSTM